MTPDVRRRDHRAGHRSDADDARGRDELRGEQTRRAVDADPVDLHVLERHFNGTAEPVTDARRVAGYLEAFERDVAGAVVARGVIAVTEPLHEERELGIGLQSLDPDLLPLQLVPVGPEAVAVDGLSAESGLDRGDVGHRDHPGEPAAAVL